MKSSEEYLAEYLDQWSSLKRQLAAFETGKMRWKISGVDRTDHHMDRLRHVIDSMETLLESYGVDFSEHTEFGDKSQ